MPRITRSSCLLVALFYWITTGAPSAYSQVKPNLRVGVVLPLSGTMGPYGQEVLNGINLALEHLKKADPDVANRIAIISKDGEGVSGVSEKAARQLLSNERADILIGSVTNPTTMSLASLAMELRKPLVAPAATNAAITKRGEYVFRTCNIDANQGAIMARFAATNLKKTTAAIIFEPGSEYSVALANQFEKTFTQNGGTITGKVEFKAGTEDFKAIITKARKGRPAIMFVPGYNQDATKIINQAHALAVKTVFLGGDGWDSPDLYKEVDKAALKNVYYTISYSELDPDPKIQEFIKAYQSASFASGKPRRPSALAISGYDAMTVVYDAFKRAHNHLSEPLTRALNETKDVATLLGNLSINAQRDAEKPAVVISATADGPRFSARVSPTP